MRVQRAGRQVVGVGSLPDARLVGSDVRIAAGVEQPPLGIVDGNREITPHAGAIVEVEDGRPCLLAAAHAADRLDLLVVERECIPIDVTGAGDVAGDADGVAVGLQQVADILGRGERVVAAAGVLAGLTHQWRVPRQSLHVEPNRRVADVGEADGRARLLVELPLPHAKFVGTARGPVLHLRRIGEVGLVGGVVQRRHAAVGDTGGHRLIPRLASHANEILDRRADRLPVAGQHDPHAGILRVDRVVVSAIRGIASQGLRQPLRARTDGRRRIGIRERYLRSRHHRPVIGERQYAGRRVIRSRRGQPCREVAAAQVREHDGP